PAVQRPSVGQPSAERTLRAPVRPTEAHPAGPTGHLSADVTLSRPPQVAPSPRPGLSASSSASPATVLTPPGAPVQPAAPRSTSTAAEPATERSVPAQSVSSPASQPSPVPRAPATPRLTPSALAPSAPASSAPAPAPSAPAPSAPPQPAPAPSQPAAAVTSSSIPGLDEAAVLELLRTGHKLEAIRLVRSQLGVDTHEAAETVERLHDRLV
ncbi:MAG: hypothetical protein Q4G45_08835, partial [Actinomycetia bacterium]|nr:hypothetical protein [Actinomycetes bacterium]